MMTPGEARRPSSMHAPTPPSLSPSSMRSSVCSPQLSPGDFQRSPRLLEVLRCLPPPSLASASSASLRAALLRPRCFAPLRCSSKWQTSQLALISFFAFWRIKNKRWKQTRCFVFQTSPRSPQVRSPGPAAVWR